MIEQKCEEIKTKVILLGESYVGKTSIIERFTRDMFKNNFAPTLSVSHNSRNMFFKKFEKKIKFELWDTAGTEKFRSLTKVFYNRAEVVIYIYDITRKETFEQIKKYWIKETMNLKENFICALVGNKYDLFDNEEVDESQARKLAKEYNAIFKVVSAKSSTGINELFHEIGLKLLNNNVNKIYVKEYLSDTTECETKIMSKNILNDSINLKKSKLKYNKSIQTCC